MATKDEILFELQQWREAEIDSWFNRLNPRKLTFKKLVTVAKNSLTIVSSSDAAEFMIKHDLTMTNANVAKFNVLADEFYKIRRDILSELVLKEKLK